MLPIFPPKYILLIFLTFTAGACNSNITNQNVDTRSAAISVEYNEKQASQKLTVSLESGAEAQIPPGTLAIGAQIEMSEAEKPQVFAEDENVLSLSEPVSIKAQTAQGEPIDEVSIPFTIQIQGQQSGLSLVNFSLDDVCILGVLSNGKLVSYESSNMEILLVQSLIIATFQTKSEVYNLKEILDQVIEYNYIFQLFSKKLQKYKEEEKGSFSFTE